MGTQEYLIEVEVENTNIGRTLQIDDMRMAIRLEQGVSMQKVELLSRPVDPVQEEYVPPVFAGNIAPIAVAVICHEAYLDILPRQIAAIDGQTVSPAEKLLVLDGCEPPAGLPADWQVITGKWGSPNPGRNEAAIQCKTPWIIFADADDVMHYEYVAACAEAAVAAGPGVGVIYSDIVYSNGQKLNTPAAWDYWELRRRNFISSTSCWQRHAVLISGGWPEDTKCYDDYSLALAVTRYGFRGKKCKGIIQVDNHQDGHRRHASGDGRQFPHLWNHRTYAIVTLLAGREENMDAWANFLTTADIPPNTSVYVLDNGRSDVFRHDVAMALEGLRDKFQGMHYIRCDATIPEMAEDDPAAKFARHMHVARLYNQILPMVREDMVVLLEDDMVPPQDGLRKLVEAFDPKERHGAIGAIYLSRINEDTGEERIVGSQHDSYWTGRIDRCDVAEDKLYPFRQIAGGFTLYSNGCLQKALPTRFAFTPDGMPTGWDTNVSLAITQQGYRLFLHGGVYAEHRYQGTK